MLAFSFKIRNMFSVKDPVSAELRSSVVYKFTCAVILAMSTKLADASRHAFNSRTLKEVQDLTNLSTPSTIRGMPTTQFQVKIKKALHISWEQLVNSTLSF